MTVPAGSHVVCVFQNVSKDRPEPPGPPNVDLAITKVVSEPVVQLGERVTWTVTLTNKGPATATNIVVKDTLPEGVKYVSGSLDVPAGVTCDAAVCTVASLAPNRSGTATFETTATQVGEHINLVNIQSLDQKDVNPADNAASAKLQVEGTPVETVTPLLECVDQLANGKRRAHFGYVNSGGSTDVIPKGPRNKFDPLPHDRGQPDQFRTGRNIDVFQVEFESDELTWTLEGRRVQATSTSPSCNATLRIDKTLDPANDPGRFNLEIDGSVAGSGANVGNQGTTGDVIVAALPAGQLAHGRRAGSARDERGGLRHHDRLPERRWRRCGAGLLEQRRRRGYGGAGRRRRLHDRQHA